MDAETTAEEDRIKELELELRNLSRKHQELNWVYEERGKQIGRLEVALTRALEGNK